MKLLSPNVSQPQLMSRKGKTFRSAILIALAAALAGCSEGDFSDTGGMSAPRHGHTATLIGPGRVLIAAGLTKTDPLDTAEIFDARAGGYEAPIALKIRTRGWHRAALLAGEDVLLTGG